MEAISFRHWLARQSELPQPAIDRLAADLKLTPLTARVLALRGLVSAEAARAFMADALASLPDPSLLPGMDRAVARLAAAIEQGERIAVHGDYDVDGITGAALLVETLRLLGAEVECHIPLRLKDGYGLSAAALRQAAAGGAKLALSVDCGVSALAEAQLALELGLDLIITDHHQPPAPLPAAFAIVNPHLPENRFPFRELAGVGVAFFLLVALRKTLRERGFFLSRPEPDLRRGLDLVALGTIADVVPLQGVNRILVRAGLKSMNGSERPGLRALKEVAAVSEVSCGNVAFRLAPRLNAAGRLEDALLGVELLLESSAERALAMARLLDDFNRERQEIEQETLRQAVARLEATAAAGECSIVLADPRWHPGVIGIVASRLVERYHRPAVLIALENGQGKGSARSIAGFHLYRSLEHCRRHLAGFGGHAFAAGLTIAEQEVAAFAAAFEAVARESLSAADLLPRVLHDGEVLLEELTEAAVRQLAELAPFGAGNPEPSFLVRGARAQQIQTVGGKHLRFTLRQGGYSLPCIAFAMAERQPELAGDLDFLLTPQLNEWRGRVSVQLRLKDFRPAQEETREPLRWTNQ
jgi:single-stranded-DNA-specific exonuclease